MKDSILVFTSVSYLEPSQASMMKLFTETVNG